MERLIQLQNSVTEIEITVLTVVCAIVKKRKPTHKVEGNLQNCIVIKNEKNGNSGISPQ